MSTERLVGRSQCPKCQDTGEGNLALYEDGGAHCHACGYHRTGSGASSSFANLTQENFTVSRDFNLSACFKSRGVDETTLARYQVRAFVSERTGEPYVGFPLHDKTGALQTYHYRGTEAGSLNRQFWYDSGTKLRLPVFGWHLVNKSKADTVVVCEGETDTLALATYLRARPDVVVVGAVGTGFARPLAAWLSARLDKRHKLVLAFDNDKAGREATAEVVSNLRNSRPNLKPLQLIFEGEDVGAALAAGEQLSLEATVPASVSSFLSAPQIAQDVDDFILAYNSKRAIRLNFSPSLDSAVRIQPGTLIGTIGAGGCGKSTLDEHILLETLNSPGARAMMLSAEMKANEVGLKLVSTKEGFGYLEDEWLRSATAEDRKKLRASVTAACARFSISDEFGGMSVEELEQAVQEQIAVGNAPDLVVVDHFLAIAGELENTSLEQTAKAFKAIARNCNTCVVVICHIRKPPTQGGKRTIYRPTMADEYGSGGLGKYCDCVLGVAIDVRQSELLVETVKRERLGGKDVDVRLKLTNWQLHEVSSETPGNTYSYDEDDSYE